jgi:hypothetical protein
MAEFFSSRPRWLFSPDDAGDLKRAIDYRLSDTDTDFENVPSWSDAASELETIFLQICKNQPFP